MVKLHLLIDAVNGGGFKDVFADGRAISDVFLLYPRPPLEAEGVEIRVRADARVGEKIPCPTYTATTFEDRVAGIRYLGLESVCCINARYPCSDDDKIKRIIRSFRCQ